MSASHPQQLQPDSFGACDDVPPIQEVDIQREMQTTVAAYSLHNLSQAYVLWSVLWPLESTS